MREIEELVFDALRVSLCAVAFAHGLLRIDQLPLAFTNRQNAGLLDQIFASGLRLAKQRPQLVCAVGNGASRDRSAPERGQRSEKVDLVDHRIGDAGLNLSRPVRDEWLPRSALIDAVFAAAQVG